MSYTNPHGQPQGNAYYFTNKIREALISEIVAINGYTEHIANTDIPEVNAVLQHIVEDEKQHYGRFLTILRKYDPQQYQEYLSHTKDTFQPARQQEYQPEYNRQIILNNIREDIKGELEAVVLYEQLLCEMPYQDVREVFQAVIPVEKEHMEHLTKLMVYLDIDQYDGLS